MNTQLTNILIIFILISCGSETAKESDSQKEVTEKQVESILRKTNKVDYSDSVNFTDSNGWKQGQWIRKWNGKLVEKYTYVNDTLNGHYETDHGEGYYKNGQKDGLQFNYYGEKESILMVNYFNNGNHIWGGFPAAGKKHVISLKEFHISKDSVFVKAPYINGNTWYEGNFCLLPYSLDHQELVPYRYGIHRVYHMNGNLKAIIDYSKEIVIEYDIDGKQLYYAGFNQSKVHKLPTLGRYKKIGGNKANAL